MTYFTRSKTKAPSSNGFSTRMADISMPNGVVHLGGGNTVISNCMLSLSTLTATEKSALTIGDQSVLTLKSAALREINIIVNNSRLAVQSPTLELDFLHLSNGAVVDVEGELVVYGELRIGAGTTVIASKIRCKNLLLECGGRIEGYVTQDIDDSAEKSDDAPVAAD